MNEIRKLDRILNGEDGDVVADEIEIALVGVEFDRKAAHIAAGLPPPAPPATVENGAKTSVFLPF